MLDSEAGTPGAVGNHKGLYCPPQSLLALQWPKQRAFQSLTHLQKQRRAGAGSLSSLTSLWTHPTTLSAAKSMQREVNQEGGVHQVRSHP